MRHRNVADLVHEDMMIKKYISRASGQRRHLEGGDLAGAEESHGRYLHARPGIVIGRRGAEVDKLREELQLLTKKDILLNIVEVRKPELDAKLVADSIAHQLEGRISFRRAMKKVAWLRP